MSDLPYPPNWLLWLTVVMAFIMVLDMVLDVVKLLLQSRRRRKDWERWL